MSNIFYLCVGTSDCNPFCNLRVFCFLICSVKVARLEIQQPSGLLEANVLRSILIYPHIYS